MLYLTLPHSKSKKNQQTEGLLHPGIHRKNPKGGKQRSLRRWGIRVSVSCTRVCFYSNEIKWYFFFEHGKMETIPHGTLSKNIFYFNSSRFLECNGLSGKPLLYLRHVSFSNFTFNSIKTCVTHFAVLHPRCCWWEEPGESPAVLLTILKHKSPPYPQHPPVGNNWFMPLQSQVRAQRKTKTVPSIEQGHCTLRPQAHTIVAVRQAPERESQL